MQTWACRIAGPFWLALLPREFPPRDSACRRGERSQSRTLSQAFVAANQAGLRSNFDHAVWKLTVCGMSREQSAAPAMIVAIAVQNPEVLG